MIKPDLLDYLVSELRRCNVFKYKGEVFDFSNLDLTQFALSSPATTYFILTYNKTYNLKMTNEQIFYIIKNTPLHICLTNEDLDKTVLEKWSLSKEIVTQCYLDTIGDTLPLVIATNLSQNLNLTPEQFTYIFNHSDLNHILNKKNNLFIKILSSYEEEGLKIMSKEQLEIIMNHHVVKTLDFNSSIATYYLFYKSMNYFPENLFNLEAKKKIASTADLEREMHFYITNNFVEELFFLRDDKDAFLDILKKRKLLNRYSKIEAYLERQRLSDCLALNSHTIGRYKI